MRIELGIMSLALLCVPCPRALAAQDPEPTVGPTPIEIPGLVDEAQEEMLQLFRDIEEKLRAVDVLLSDAGAGDTSKLEEVEEAGIGKLLERSRSTSLEVLNDIDRLLELAQQQGGGGAGGGEPQESSPSPSQGQPQGSPGAGRGNQTTQREQTPEGPGQSPQNGEEPGGEQPGQEHPEGEQPGPDGERPTDGQDSSGRDPENKPGSTPPSDPTAGGSQGGLSRDRWGDLPVHYQDVFRGEDSGEMPVRYREWIDAYHRRLNQHGGR